MDWNPLLSASAATEDEPLNVFIFDIHLGYHQALPRSEDGITNVKGQDYFRVFMIRHLEDCSLSHRRQTAGPTPFICGTHLVYHQALPRVKDGVTGSKVKVIIAYFRSVTWKIAFCRIEDGTAGSAPFIYCTLSGSVGRGEGVCESELLQCHETYLVG